MPVFDWTRTDPVSYTHLHLHDKDGNEERQLYRIFYYDCEPVGRRSVYHPLTKKNVDLDKSDTCLLYTSRCV